MPRSAKILAAAGLLFLAGCSLFRWSGYKDAAPEQAGDWSSAELVLSSAPARARPPALPAPDGIPRTLYYADLGPDTIDVDGYPAQQKYNYEIFRRQCSRCHTLARAVNSPVQSRTSWHFHAARMSLRSRLKGSGPIPDDDLKAVLDFLEYDAHVRKVENRKRFEEQTAALKRRFDPTLKRLLEHMQTSPQPRLLPSAGGEKK